MKKSFDSDRLFYRELLPTDDRAMFELDSNPEVQRYTGSKVVSSIDESRAIIAQIRQQYIDHGIGRWAVILKETNEFLGWAGLKFHASMNAYENVHDLGYRFLQKHWEKVMVMNRRWPLSTSRSRKCVSPELLPVPMWAISPLKKFSRNAACNSSMIFRTRVSSANSMK